MKRGGTADNVIVIRPRQNNCRSAGVFAFFRVSLVDKTSIEKASVWCGNHHIGGNFRLWNCAGVVPCAKGVSVWDVSV